MENPYSDKKYKGDYSKSMLGPGQMGPMTEIQAKYEEGRQKRKAGSHHRTIFMDFLDWLSQEPSSKRVDILDRIGPKSKED